MQYLLSREEYKDLIEKSDIGERSADTVDKQKALIQDLRTKILEQAKYTCYHDVPPNSPEVYIDDGYCDDCPLSFCENEEKKMKYHMCGRPSHLYSK
jgi:hypothetical protein